MIEISIDLTSIDMESLQIARKLLQCPSAPLVKLSDSPGKITVSPEIKRKLLGE